jgi:hypothetical protein
MFARINKYFTDRKELKQQQDNAATFVYLKNLNKAIGQAENAFQAVKDD